MAATLTQIGRSVTIRLEPSVLFSLESLLADINSAQLMKFQGRNLTKEAIINGLLLSLFSMDHPHQIKACEEAIINLENTLELVDPSPSTEPKKENSKINK